MKNVIRVVVLLILISMGVWLWIYYHPTPEEAIRRRLNEIATTASFESRDGLVMRAVQSQTIASFFAPEISVNIRPFIQVDSISRDEIAQYYAGKIRADYSFLKVNLKDPVITLGDDKKNALVNLTVHIETTADKFFIVQEMKFTMRLEKNKWIILRAETVKTLM